MCGSWQLLSSTVLMTAFLCLFLHCSVLSPVQAKSLRTTAFRLADPVPFFTPHEVYRRTLHHFPVRGLLDSRTSLRSNKCDTEADVRDLCERCAKYTRNDKVFSMCCVGEAGAGSGPDSKPVYGWCQEFMDYRLAKRVNDFLSVEQERRFMYPQ